MDDATINRELAERLGWKESSAQRGLWNMAGVRALKPLPDYLTDPAASSDLEDWLHANGWEVAGPERRGSNALFMSVTRPQSVAHADTHGHDPNAGTFATVVIGESYSAARRRALALAAHKALSPGVAVARSGG